MKKLILWVAPILSLGLVGCEKSPASVGVSVDSTSSQVQEQGKSIGQEQSLNQSERASVTVKMPATTLLYRALDEYLSEQHKKANFRNLVVRAQNPSLASLAGKGLEEGVDPVHVGAAIVILSAFQPALGWPDGGERRFMERTHAIVSFADAVGLELLSKVGARALKDQDEAKRAILFELASIEPEVLESIWKSELELAEKQQFTFNDAGSSQPVEFRTTTAVVAVGPQGAQLQRAGAVEFGDGRIGGQTLEVGLETALQVARNRKLSLDRKQMQRETDNTKVDANLRSQ
jgi:hypothetical protein